MSPGGRAHEPSAAFALSLADKGPNNIARSATASSAIPGKSVLNISAPPSHLLSNFLAGRFGQ